MRMKQAVPALVRKRGSQSALGNSRSFLVEYLGNNDFFNALWAEAGEP
jgi:hypothetical protein